jgi:uncharacterized protein YkwD
MQISSQKMSPLNIVLVKSIFLLILYINAEAIDTLPINCLEAFRQSALDTHNIQRAKHGSPNLSRDSQLDQSALSYSNYLADKGGALVHSTDLKNTGENLYVEYSDGGVFDLKKCISKWLFIYFKTLVLELKASDCFDICS